MRVRNAHGKDGQQASGASAQDFDLRELIPVAASKPCAKRSKNVKVQPFVSSTMTQSS
jgi:hypothetical protein